MTILTLLCARLWQSGCRTCLPFPAKIMREIFSHLYRDRSLCLVSKQFLPFAREVLYETIVTYRLGRFNRLCRSLNAKPELGLLVKRLEILVHSANRTEGEYKVAARCSELFSKLNQLVKLNIESNDWFSTSFLLGEYNFPELKKIQFTARWDKWENPFDIRHWKNLANYPKLEEIDLSCWCQHPGFAKFSASGPKPVLQNLSISKLSLLWFDLELSDEHLREWLEFLAPKSLKFEAHYNGPNPFPYLPINLKELQLPVFDEDFEPNFYTPLSRFIHLERLEILAKWLLNLATCFDSIPHQNLRRLKIRETPRKDDFLQSMKVLAEKLRAKWAPKLESITLDLYSKVYALQPRMDDLLNSLEEISGQRENKFRMMKTVQPGF